MITPRREFYEFSGDYSEKACRLSLNSSRDEIFFLSRPLALAKIQSPENSSNSCGCAIIYE